MRAIIVVLWRAGLRISEALALNETDVDQNRGSVLVRHGKRDKRRELGTDRWVWTHPDPWLELRREISVGRRFCVLRTWTHALRCFQPHASMPTMRHRPPLPRRTTTEPASTSRSSR